MPRALRRCPVCGALLCRHLPTTVPDASRLVPRLQDKAALARAAEE